MHTGTVSCPRCLVPVDLSTAESARRCPRCGQELALPPGGSANGIKERQPAAMSKVNLQPSATRPANRQLALAIVATMLALAGLSLYAGLRSMPGRRARDARDPLAFLPSDTNVIALVEANKAFQDVGGNELLNDLRIGGRGIGIEQIEHWCGLGRQEMGVIVAASRIDTAPVPRTVLVIETLHPHPESKLISGVPLVGRSLHGNRTVYRIRGGKNASDAVLWCAAETILVIAFDADDFDAVPEEPHRGLDYLDRDLCRLLIDRVPRDAEAFIVGHGMDWQHSGLRSILLRIPKAQKLLPEIEDFALWCRFDNSVYLGLSVHTKDSAGADSILKWREEIPALKMVQATVGDGWLTMTGPATSRQLNDWWDNNHTDAGR